MDPTDADFRRLAKVKSSPARQAHALGAEMASFFKHSVERTHTKMGKIAACWQKVVPSPLQEHCALEGFTRGTLTVLVDTSAHLYDLKQLLLAGIEQQLMLACKGAGLRKVVLKKGQWYEATENGNRKLRF